MSTFSNPTKTHNKSLDFRVDFKFDPGQSESTIFAHLSYQEDTVIFPLNQNVQSSEDKNDKSLKAIGNVAEVKNYTEKITGMLSQAMDHLKEGNKEVTASTIHDKFVELYGKQLNLK